MRYASHALKASMNEMRRRRLIVDLVLVEASQSIKNKMSD
jgi:hypothetical protein